MACTHAVQISERFEDSKMQRIITSRYCLVCNATTWWHMTIAGQTTGFWSLTNEARKKRLSDSRQDG